MYICPECNKVFKVQGNNKKVKCTKCSALLKDSNVSMDEWESLSADAKAEIKRSVCSANDTVINTPVDVQEINEPTISKQSQAKTISCPQCGANVVENSKFCNECGYSFGGAKNTSVTPVVMPAVATPEPKSKSLFDGYEEKIQSYPSNTTKPSTNLMKCPSCGADIESNSKKCSYCGASITYSMRREQEQVNKEGCPKCGSSNIQFKRENHGELRGKKSKKIIHKTVGFCKDCGYTWYPSSGNDTSKNKTWLWILGWLFIFPLPLTILLLRKKEMKPALKYGIIAAAWLVYLLIGIGGNSNSKTSKDTPDNIKSETVSEIDSKTDIDSEMVSDLEENQEENKEEGNSNLYSNAEIVDMMSGSGKNKIGTITVSRADQAECTEENLLDWYFNFVKVNNDSKYHVIVYNDNPNKGVYSSGTGFIESNTFLTEEDDGTYSLGDDAGSTYYTVDEENKALNVMSTMADESIIYDAENKIDELIPDDYKNGDLYMVDVAGPEGALDCNLTLINEGFADGDYQSIATDLASQIKDLNLGIKYFCIAFQCDDYTLNALSSIDDLSNQDPSEISTDKYK